MEAPELRQLPRYPAVGGTCVIALGIFALAPPDMVEPLQLDLRAFWAEPWRILTSNLLHAAQLQSEDFLGGLFHVGFNCYWIWLLGTQVEARLGHLRTLGLLVAFGLGGALLEYGMSGPAVGLSGVVYGLVGMLVVLARRPDRSGTSPRWRGCIDDRSRNLMGVWFLACIAMTLLEVMPIANFAHAGGAILGALVGWSLRTSDSRAAKPNTASDSGPDAGPRRFIPARLASAGLALGLFAALASVARPWVNLSTRAGIDAMVLAQRADSNDELELALRYAERGVGYWRTPADHWAYLGGLYYRNGDPAKAASALAEAVARDPENDDYRLAQTQFEQIAAASQH